MTLPDDDDDDDDVQGVKGLVSLGLSRSVFSVVVCCCVKENKQQQQHA